jgi:predicted DNA-binding transcriptional regulator AlpA
MKSLQAAKISEVAQALINTGYVHLPEQASVLGLPRSTTWTILNAKHKNYGLSAAVIKRMLAQPHLPRLVRSKICEYVNEKCAGRYGDNPQRMRRFSSALSSDQQIIV